jgi:hypothetical protein
MAVGRPYEFEVNGVIVRCADAQAAADLIRELQDGRRPTRAKRDQSQSGTARKAILDGLYRTALTTLVENHPDGVFGDVLLAQIGLEDAKGLGGFMTGLRKQCRTAGLPEPAIIRERRKNGGGAWKNNFRLDDKAVETLRKWLEG